MASDASVDGGSASTLVWRGVLKDVYDGVYQPSQRLTEVRLTETYGVSRSSVREALSRLAAEGVVILERHKGAVIKAASWRELLDTLLVLDPLIALAARLAADNIHRGDNRERAAMELRHLATIESPSKAFDFAKERNRFYQLLISLTHNDELRRVIGTIHVHRLRVQLGARSPVSNGLYDYMGILSAVLIGNGTLACELARAHIAVHIDVVRQAILADPGA